MFRLGEEEETRGGKEERRREVEGRQEEERRRRGGEGSGLDMSSIEVNKTSGTVARKSLICVQVKHLYAQSQFQIKILI